MDLIRLNNKLANFKFDIPLIGGSNNDDNDDNDSNDSNNKVLKFMEPSKMTLYTIPKGTLLYFGSFTTESFNPNDIKLDENNSISYFSSNKRLIADYIVGCALYPTKQGFLHKFRVKRDINKILIISTFERKANWTLSYLDETYCFRKNKTNLNGLGFFFPRKDEQDLYNLNNDDSIIDPKISFDAEFIICDPNEFLEYLSTQRCIGMRKLSPEYIFNN